MSGEVEDSDREYFVIQLTVAQLIDGLIEEFEDPTTTPEQLRKCVSIFGSIKEVITDFICEEGRVWGDYDKESLVASAKANFILLQGGHFEYHPVMDLVWRGHTLSTLTQQVRPE